MPTFIGRLSSGRSCFNGCDGCERYPAVTLAISPNLKEVRTVGIVQVVTCVVLPWRQEEMVLASNQDSFSRTTKLRWVISLLQLLMLRQSENY
jgi:hypothetical protein